MTAASAVVLAAPASAGTACSAGYHCIFYLGFDSAKHSFFDNDSNFAGNTFNQTGSNGGSAGLGYSADDNTVSASNSSTGGYESHYYANSGYTNFIFCVNPGSEVDYIPTSLQNRASSLKLWGTTPVNCY